MTGSFVVQVRHPRDDRWQFLTCYDTVTAEPVHECRMRKPEARAARDKVRRLGWRARVRRAP